MAAEAKIFIVEDERIVSLALERTLGQLGYAVAGAETTGEAAVAAIEQAKPDLVLMDIRLHGELDGVAAAEQIRARHGVPVIYLTGYSDGETLSRAKVTEPSGYIVKPFQERELQIAIDTALYRHAHEAERQRLETQLRQLQKLESVGRLAAGLAHDFNNLLTVIHGHTDALRTAAESDRERSLDGIAQAVDHAAQLTRQLLAFSRQQCVQLRPLDMNVVIENIRAMIGRLLGASIDVRFQPGHGLPCVQADAGMLEQTLLNLAVNARDAMPEGGSLTIRTTVVNLDAIAAAAHAEAEARPGRFVRLEVVDTGSGMDAETLRRACEPFYTTKPVGQGTGLGLSTVYGIVQQHGGWLELESDLGRGTVCRVFLPVDAAASATTATAVATVPPTGSAVTPAPAAGRGETILLVEDEDGLRDLVETMLKDAGYRVIAASSGVEALALWEHHAARIDLVLTDMVMPDGMSGRQLAERLLISRPALKIIYSSGYSRDLTDPGFASGKNFFFLEKPYRSARLVALVRECLDDAGTAAAAAV